MARPVKQGLDYFPLDVDFLENIKVRKILRSCGAGSIAVLISLLGSIYSDNGYYIGWDSDMPFLIADRVGVSEGAVQEIVSKAIQVGFFDNDMFEKHKILTSKGIQSRFFGAISRRKELEICNDYLLVMHTKKIVNVDNNSINVCNNSINVDNNSVNVCSNEQRKEKKSKEKEKESKVKKYICSSEANELFEKLWAMYPRKRGKNQITDAKKRAIAEVGEEKMILALTRYNEEVKDTEEQYILNGSTFFNGRYRDYIGEDFVPKKNRTKKQYRGIEEWLNEQDGI